MEEMQILLSQPYQTHLNLSSQYLVHLVSLNQIDLQALADHHPHPHPQCLGHHQYLYHASRHSNHHLHLYHCLAFHQSYHRHRYQYRHTVAQDFLKIYIQNSLEAFLIHQKYHQHPSNRPYLDFDQRKKDHPANWKGLQHGDPPTFQR